MKNFNKNSIVSIVTLAVSVVSPLSGLIMPATALAATAPSLGAADDFAVLAGASIVDSNISNIISGHVGLSPAAGTNFGALTSAEVADTIYAVDASGPDSTTGNNPTLVGNAQTALTAAYTNAANQTPATTVVASTIDSFSGTGYTLAPGIYKSTSTMGITGTLTLSGSATDVWIFQAVSSLTTAASTNVVLTGGAQACNVFWQVGSSATLGTNSLFKGTIMADQSITDNGGAVVQGRLLASIGSVTLNNTTVTKSTCAATPTPTPDSQGYGTINVVKLVINDNGGTKVVSDFGLFINGQPAVSGQTYTFSAPASAFTVTENGDTNYARSFAGDCDTNGQINLNPGDNKFCVVTNDDIGVSFPDTGLVPPLINVVKVPNPLALPGGPGPVTYTYTLRNIGTVPVTDVTMVGDTCSPIVRVSGDTNGDNKLDVSETWVHTCSTTLSETHTNIVTATGWANGISAVDVASARVVVGAPIVPPLINIVKMPSVFTRSSPGPVTYTFTVTNPGTVALSNVSVYDNKCSPPSAHSGDVNGNNMLDVSETWVYSCQTNLASNTVNTATATGMANGLTAVDLSVATVLVTPPGFPDTGIAPDKQNNVWAILMLAGIFTALILVRRKQVA